MKRIFDIAAALAALCIFFVPMLFLSLLIKCTSQGPVIYWSDRIGRNNGMFRMLKFRTMRIDTPAMATHLMRNPDDYLTPLGKFLRKSSLDELPQLFNVLAGNMSLVGPRPALYNQEDLIALRTQKGIHKLLPGITGWAQINGRDELSIPVKVAHDEYYLNHRSFGFDLMILWKTVINVVKKEGVAH
ncbi:MAG: sugar transferase [Deltaproteobacteria bacterium]|nr:sugar transferase [Deltaproteobacteria bacterium]